MTNNSASLDLSTLPTRALELSGGSERQQVAELVATVARWSGFGTSMATKVLHKKRPALIPILDNQAIFGAYWIRAGPVGHPARKASTVLGWYARRSIASSWT
jgi:hypothetical protein